MPLLPHEIEALNALRTEAAVQAFLDAASYSTEPIYRCPRSVLRDRRAHCFDGAVFAAAALERLGHRPLIVDLRAVRDDDHVLAVYRRDGLLGAVSKSNVVMLRWREPLFRTLRELVLSYFDFYYNLDGEKTLREFSRAVDLRRFDRLDWRADDAAMDAIAAHLDAVRHERLMTAAQEARLGPIDRRTFDAGLMGADWDGLYKPRESKR